MKKLMMTGVILGARKNKLWLTKACVQVGLKELYLNFKTINNGSGNVKHWFFKYPTCTKPSTLPASLSYQAILKKQHSLLYEKNNLIPFHLLNDAAPYSPN